LQLYLKIHDSHHTILYLPPELFRTRQFSPKVNKRHQNAPKRRIFEKIKSTTAFFFIIPEWPKRPDLEIFDCSDLVFAIYDKTKLNFNTSHLSVTNVQNNHCRLLNVSTSFTIDANRFSQSFLLLIFYKNLFLLFSCA
jgi:hypothetical protein